MFKDLNLKLHPTIPTLAIPYNFYPTTTTSTTTTTTTATQPATIVLSSIAGAAEHRGSTLGEYVQADEEYLGHVYYKQRHNVASGGYYVYKEGWRWYASKTLGGAAALRSQKTGDLLPPTKNWEYWDGGRWRKNDTSLTLTFASLPTPCPVVRVVGEGDVVEMHWSSLGDYRFDFINVLYIMHVIRIQVSSSPRN